MSAFNPQYTVHLVSFRNMEHGSAYNVLHRGQVASDWQIRELERFVEELKTEQMEAKCGDLL